MIKSEVHEGNGEQLEFQLLMPGEHAAREEAEALAYDQGPGDAGDFGHHH